MKNFKKFIILAVGMILSVCLLCACVETNDGSQSEELHVCKHVCETCGKCTDIECKNEVCKDKCQGHTPVEKTYNLKVMSFNLDQGNGSNAAMNKKVYEKIVDELPDLLGVQEETPEWRGYLEKVLQPEGYARVGKFRATDPSHAYYGFKEASSVYYNVDRFTLVEEGTFWLSDTPETEGSVATSWSSKALFPRVCTYVVVKDKKSDKQFAYFNTHFSYEDAALRYKSAELIVSRIQAKGIPAFFSGDLNYASNEETDTYNLITAKMDDSRVKAKSTMNGNTFHAYGYGPGELAGDGDVTKTVPIDYIFSTKGDFEVASFRILKVEGRKGVPEDYYSVHFSIVAQYSYKVGA